MFSPFGSNILALLEITVQSLSTTVFDLIDQIISNIALDPKFISIIIQFSIIYPQGSAFTSKPFYDFIKECSPISLVKIFNNLLVVHQFNESTLNYLLENITFFFSLMESLWTILIAVDECRKS